MAQTLCPKCGRSFRTQSGLAWHVEHSHPEARQAMLAQDQPKEAGTACRADLEQVQEKLAELDTRLEMAAQKQKTVEAKLEERVEKTTAETKDKLVEWLEVRLSNVLRGRFESLEQRVSSLESEQRILKTQEDSLERRLDSLHRRISALEPIPEVCSLSRKPHSVVCQKIGR